MAALEWADYGWANGWKETPERVRQAMKRGLRETRTQIGDCAFECVCEELRYRYRVDTSG